jgi:dihydrodipicolinate synthase/N-acetylneuraminate lyase
MDLHLAPDRKPFGDDLEILRLELLAERRGEDLARLAADQRPSVSELAALRERFVDRHIARLAILDEEDGVRDLVEELNSREGPSKDGGERRGRIALVGGARRNCAGFQSLACVFIKNGSPRRANVQTSANLTLGSPKMPSQVFSGTIPALMTPCGPDRRPDFDALVKMGKHLVAAGMSGLVYCGSMGDWPLLTIEQRMEGVERLTKAGLPVVVGTGAQNTEQAAALARHAKEKGARGLMIIPRVLSRGSSTAAQRGHFARVLTAAIDLPSVIYNSPYYGFQTKADLFFELRKEFSHLVGFKEFGSAESMSYAAEHIAGRSDDVALMVGVDTQVFHGIVNCGACGAITGIGNVLPREVLRLVELCERAAKGDAQARRLALELESALEPLSVFDEGADLALYFKRLMTLVGHDEYAWHLNDFDALSPSQEGMAKRRFTTFRAWWASWPGAKD